MKTITEELVNKITNQFFYIAMYGEIPSSKFDDGYLSYEDLESISHQVTISRGPNINHLSSHLAILAKEKDGFEYIFKVDGSNAQVILVNHSLVLIPEIKTSHIYPMLFSTDPNFDINNLYIKKEIKERLIAWFKHLQIEIN